MKMSVEIVWDCDTLVIPLSQLKPFAQRRLRRIDPDDDTLEATAEDGAQASRIVITG